MATKTRSLPSISSSSLGRRVSNGGEWATREEIDQSIYEDALRIFRQALDGFTAIPDFRIVLIRTAQDYHASGERKADKKVAEEAKSKGMGPGVSSARAEMRSEWVAEWSKEDGRDEDDDPQDEDEDDDETDQDNDKDETVEDEYEAGGDGDDIYVGDKDGGTSEKEGLKHPNASRPQTRRQTQATQRQEKGKYVPGASRTEDPISPTSTFHEGLRTRSQRGGTKAEAGTSLSRDRKLRR